MTDVELPEDCGNSPRIKIVGDIVAQWAQGQTDLIGAWVTEDVRWTIVGGETYHGQQSLGAVSVHPAPDRAVILAVINHGRLAACDGYLEAQGRRTYFSHTFRFAGATKTAKVAEVRSYLIQ